MNLRSQADIGNCRIDTPTEDINVALFDIKNDPCETKNIINDQPEIYKYLQNRLDEFRKELVPQQNKASDPCSNPAFANGTWFTWLSDPSPLCQENINIIS